MKLYLAICLVVASWLAAFEALWSVPADNDAYPAPEVSAPVNVPQWIDGCGVWHDGELPYPFPTAVPMEECAYP